MASMTGNPPTAGVTDTLFPRMAAMSLAVFAVPPGTNRRIICRFATIPLTVFAPLPSDLAVSADESSSPPPPDNLDSTSLNKSCDARYASSRVPAVAPMPALSFLRNCLTADVRPLPSFPRPWPMSQPIDLSSFIPTLSFSSFQNESPCRPAELYISRNRFASPLPMF
eukprot:6579111-Prymnesium_polylepis.1